MKNIESWLVEALQELKNSDTFRNHLRTGNHTGAAVMIRDYAVSHEWPDVISKARAVDIVAAMNNFFASMR